MTTNQAKSPVVKSTLAKQGVVLWSDSTVTWASAFALWGRDTRLGANQAKSSITKAVLTKSTIS